ncbi:DUF4416 family protein [bacterium]|nr:DUF4416 family protein [bacterium]
MAEINAPLRVKPFCGILFTPDIAVDTVVRRLELALGTTDEESPVFDFQFTRYYEDEMGTGLRKLFVSFQDLILPDELTDLKLHTNVLEADWSVEGRRRVNLDPGYVSNAKLVLASTKDYAHRLYLGKGIYGDVQLRYMHGRFISSDWTYPDYKTDLAIRFFQSLRNRYYIQEKQHG